MDKPTVSSSFRDTASRGEIMLARADYYQQQTSMGFSNPLPFRWHGVPWLPTDNIHSVYINYSDGTTTRLDDAHSEPYIAPNTVELDLRIHVLEAQLAKLKAIP